MLKNSCWSTMQLMIKTEDLKNFNGSHEKISLGYQVNCDIWLSFEAIITSIVMKGKTLNMSKK